MSIYKKEGLYGFGKGFSACFYGSVVCGFTFFYLYKTIKLQIYDIFGFEVNPTLVFFTASIAAECLTIIVYFPYDLVKCRLQTKNHLYEYKSLPQAFSKIIKSKGVFGLYQGCLPFLCTYATFIGIQFTMYEYLFNSYKNTCMTEKEL